MSCCEFPCAANFPPLTQVPKDRPFERAVDNRNCATVVAGLTREARVWATIWLKPRPNGVFLYFVPRGED
jgi:hypothetical protein